jgi:anti-sigma-K factor RskA
MTWVDECCASLRHSRVNRVKVVAAVAAAAGAAVAAAAGAVVDAAAAGAVVDAAAAGAAMVVVTEPEEGSGRVGIRVVDVATGNPSRALANLTLGSAWSSVFF